eukprot:CAMPEP_0171752948 /NCGR_PEP_ID=MMETSP0991-20121206/42936_1 /TAXON_ID=483369 /ORGANISM="non described non described, Strain CCMP2098" /LENGTH=535 /DNA_ID=CAMNT_0012354461 /DNA_START=242 /DNA_END=1849 /DNA_ORIENTATION=+
MQHRLIVLVSLWLAAAAEDHCLSIGATYALPEEGSTLPPQVLVSFTAGDTECEARVVYKKLSGAQQLATPWSPTTGDMSVLRLAPGVDYSLDFYSRPVGSADQFGASILNGSFTMPQTAWPWLTSAAGESNGEGFIVSLTGTPSWELFTTEVHATSSAPPFSGFVTVDVEGDIVWFWNLSTPSGTPDFGSFATHSIDQRTDHSFAVQSMVADNPLEVVSPQGEVLKYLAYSGECGILTHEGRLNGDKTKLLTVRQTWLEVPGLALPQIGNTVAEWDFEGGGSWRDLYDLSEFFDPSSERGFLSRSTYAASCNGTTLPRVQDWTHANSVSVSAFDGSLIVSVRQLSTVCSFLPEPPAEGSGGGLQWCVSSEFPDRSNFTFVDEADMFFNEHAVMQLESGNLVLFDNGNARVEGGYAGGGSNSRGIEFELDWSALTIRKVWDLPVVYDSHQGSTYAVPGTDHSLVFVPDNGGDASRRVREEKRNNGSALDGGQPTGLCMATEVDRTGQPVAELLARIYDDTPYRGIPSTSINGERPL